MIQRTKKQQGFTLIELLLSTTFIALVLLFIVFALLQVMQNYNKGLAVKQINETARSIVEEMARLVRTVNAEAINTAAIANGRACFDGVSYVWNVRNNTANRFTDNTIIGMVRVEDRGGVLCGQISPGVYPNVDKTKSISLLSSQVWVQEVGVVVASNQKLVDLQLKLSTSGNNQPTVVDGSGFICAGNSNAQFCATGSFSTTVTTRNGGE